MFQTTTLAAAITASVAARLADPNFTRWTPNELSALTVDALRTWNALTGQSRDQCTFQTVAGQPFYDLAAVCPHAASGDTVVDRDLIGQMEAACSMPVTTTAWTRHRPVHLGRPRLSLATPPRDQFLMEIGSGRWQRSAQTVNPTTNGRVSLSEWIIDISARRSLHEQRRNDAAAP